MQGRYNPAPMPALAKWVAARLRPDLERWHNRPRREAMQVRLDAMAHLGSLSRLVALAEDRMAWAMDSAGAQQAANEVANIDAEIAAIDNDDKIRFADAERLGRAIAGGIELCAFILVVPSGVRRTYGLSIRFGP